MADLPWLQTERDGILCFRSASPTLSLRALYENCTDFDVELFGTNTASENLNILQPIRAHKMILMYASEHFRKVFTDCSYIDFFVHAFTRMLYSTHLTQYTLTDVIHEDLSDIVKFIYTDELNFHAECVSERMQKFLAAAKFLIMPTLASACEKYLTSDQHLNLRNCTCMFRFARKYACTLLLDAALNLVAKNLPYFAQNPEFLELSREEFIKLLSDPVISLADPDERCCVAVAWLTYNRASRNACVGDVLDEVPFDLDTISVALLVAAWDNSAIRTKYGEKFMNVIARTVKTFQRDDRRYYSKRAVLDVLWNASSSRDAWYVIGGAKAANEFVFYDVERRFWSKLPDLPWTRSYAGACVMDKTIFLFGGRKDEEISADIDSFNLLTHTWTQNDDDIGAKLGRAQQRVSVCVTAPRAFNSNGKSAYIIGGSPHEISMQKLNVCDDDGKLLVSLEVMPKMPVGRYGAAAVCVDDVVFVVGGGRNELKDSRLSSVDKYDCVTNKWSTVGNLNYGRSSLMSVFLGDRLYLAGGYDGKSSVDVVEVLNTRTSQIHQAPNMLKARNSGSGVALDRNTFCVVGGRESDLNSSSLSSVECFDIREGKWTTGVIVADMPTANCAFGFVSF